MIRDCSAPHVSGVYVGAEVEYVNGRVLVKVFITRKGKTYPQVLDFSETAYADFQYVLTREGHSARSLWEAHQTREKDAARHRVRRAG